MSTQQEDWIYLEEDLPEIHIREIISIEELLEQNPNFVALSEEEIYNFLLRMFEERPSIADIYFGLHKDIIQPKDRFEQYYKHILYQVNAKRKAFDTEESEQEYFSTLENIRKNQSYKIREQIKAELQDPFERKENVEESEESVNKIGIPRGKRLRIELFNEETSKTNESLRLEADKEKYEILSGNFYVANHVTNMYIDEHILTKQIQPLSDQSAVKKDVDLSTIQESVDLDPFTIFTKSIVPSFKHIIDQIDPKNTSDIHSLQVLFELYGRNLEDIDIHSYYDLMDMIKLLEYKEDEYETKKEDESESEIENESEIEAESETESEEIEEEEMKKRKKKGEKEKKEKKSKKEQKLAKKSKKEKVKKDKNVKKEAKQVIKSEKRDIKTDDISYVKLHKMFWDSVAARLGVATDAPLYSDLINNAIATILAKPFRAELYVPLPKRLEGLEHGNYKLDEFIRDIQLLRNLDERTLLSEFRVAVQTLQGSGEPKVFTDLETAITNKSNLSAKTVDPDQAQSMFSTKSLVKEYTDKDELKKGYEPIDETLGAEDVGHYTVEEVEAYVEHKPENEEDVELEEEEDELVNALEHYNTNSIGKAISSISEVLTRIQRLTNMPWNPEEFIKILIQRAPPIIDIGIAMNEINNTIQRDIIDKITEGSLEEAIELLPMDQHTLVKSIYQKAKLKLKEQRNKMFFLFLSYWILHIQSLMLEDMFLLQEITNSPCKSELTGIGYPLEEGKDGKKGVLKYFVCILHEEGHDIPNIQDIVDEYSKEQLTDMIKEGFAYFTHEIETLKTQTYREVVYQGNLMEKEANEAYDTIIKLKKQKIFKANELLKPYIKSLQLLPSILQDAKDRHKHILGCCYTRLDSEYMAANTLSKRLIASKNYFARERIGQKKRPILIDYGVSAVNKEKFEKLEKEKKIEKKIEKEVKKDPGITAIEEEASAIIIESTWKEEITKMPFISQEIKEKIRNIENRQVIQQLEDEANRYLEALYKTTNIPMDKKISNQLDIMSIQELFGLFIQICFDFYQYINKLKESASGTEANPKQLYELEIKLIETELQKAKDIIQAIKEMDIPEKESGELKSILQYIVCRTLCLPGDVEPNKRTITTTKVVKANFIQNMASYIGKELKKHLELRSTPTIEEIEKKISEIREKNKIESIKKYELNPELNKLVKQAKLQGIRIDVEDVTTEDFTENIPIKQREDERADFEGALEFQMRTEDPDEGNIDTFYDY